MIKEPCIGRDLPTCNREDKSSVGVRDGSAVMVSEVAASTQDWMYEGLRLEELSPCRYIKIDTVHVSVCVCLSERERERDVCEFLFYALSGL